MSMNDPVVLPKKITKGEELVVIPRKEYEGLLRVYKIEKRRVSVKAKKKEPKLSRGLQQALREVEEGKISKAYTDVDELIKALNA